MRLAEKLTDLIGETPLLQLNNINPAIWAKLEYFNPQGSVKDRPAYYMMKDGIDQGLIGEHTVIVESTSGNTGIALAYICTCLGLRLVLTMPESMSIERRRLLSALGAELVLTPAAEGMRGAIGRAKEICEQRKGYMPNQFESPANVLAHKETTAKEILHDMVGDVDIFVAGVGTGGTITGCGEVLKANRQETKIIAVEPAESPVLSGGKPSPHKIQGIGAGFIPKILNRDIIDEVIGVYTDEAYEAARMLSHKEGVLCGVSSGAALFAAKKIAERPENNGKKIVVILPDTGERYLSTALFE
ncbi:MAG: cysteine synthase A [Christensenella sp.]|uniref:cysteine synthase A n=1 Tax=Christensenella sp. TaxID=1935934 RepID=UPI002B1FEA51|nr:cysteine synthase A [Christensenella sp.]MEA5003628.1 cysteine synthase A [Christensenella sp.]